MRTKRLFPNYLFEASWEVCNKVGGIYTVLSTRAKVLEERLGDNLMFIGPDVWHNQPCPYFLEDNRLLMGWRRVAAAEGLRCKVGRWQVPGHPIAILVDFHPFYEHKNDIYAHLWEDYKVDSLHAYGDYDEASMFAYAAARVVESYCRYAVTSRKARVVFHANEWMTGLAALYINRYMPQVATIFTTHATSIGRSICGNRKPLYQYLEAYNGDQMARELNMESKHSIEKQTAHHVDCFTTVSDITARECEVLLEKRPDVVLPNGFEDNFVPKGQAFLQKRRTARRTLFHLANCLTGKHFSDDTLIVSTSGRYEFLNKGIDLFLTSINRLRNDNNLKKEVLAFVEVPGWVKEPRNDLKSRLLSKKIFNDPLPYPQLTHYLHNQHEDCVLSQCMWMNLWNRPEEKVTVIFIPCYLTGDDGILNLEYYDVILGNDLCVFPSYYEPWGYTPLEAVAFHVPCVTTDLAGFGLWVNKLLRHEGTLSDGVRVIHRTDYNSAEVTEQIKDTIIELSTKNPAQVHDIRINAGRISREALWKNFISHYYSAYNFALRRAETRREKLSGKPQTTQKKKTNKSNTKKL